MAYSKFTYKKIRIELGINSKLKPLFPNLVAVLPSKNLLDTLDFNKRYALFSEKSRSEGIIFPILTEICRKNIEKLSLYSGAILNGDDSKELNGECDFILSKGEQDFDLQAPLFCMMVRKNIKDTIPINIAQMESARLYNGREGKAFPFIYGCVTTATEWQFLKLENSVCYMDTERYYLDKPENILGVLQTIIDFFEDL
jgi:hypothetical protein